MTGTKVVKAFRRLLALVLIAGLTLMNVQAAELHVHATAGQVDDDHHHGPASHHHDDGDHSSSGAAQIAAVDSDDTVVHVALAAASPQTAQKSHFNQAVAPLFGPSAPVTVDHARIVARAHGPPSVVQHSLRAPPALLSL
jgi:hypothetical protein